MATNDDIVHVLSAQIAAKGSEAPVRRPLISAYNLHQIQNITFADTITLGQNLRHYYSTCSNCCCTDRSRGLLFEVLW